RRGRTGAPRRRATGSAGGSRHGPPPAAAGRPRSCAARPRPSAAPPSPGWAVDRSARQPGSFHWTTGRVDGPCDPRALGGPRRRWDVLEVGLLDGAHEPRHLRPGGLWIARPPSLRLSCGSPAGVPAGATSVLRGDDVDGDGELDLAVEARRGGVLAGGADRLV